MKIEMSFLERGYTANLFRVRASRQRQLASERSGSATRQELEQEAEYCETQARKLDDAEEPAAVSDKAPIRANPRADLDNVDGPATNGHAS